jgi:hypothetical protein
MHMTDDHTGYARDHAAERYLLGDMTEADRERYEEHFFSCADCADDVRQTARFLEDARGILVPAPAAAPRPAGVAVLRPRAARPVRSLFWPLPAGAAAAAALLAVLAGYQAIHVAGLRRELSAERQLQALPATFLSISRSETPTVQVSKGQRKVALKFSQSFERAFPFFRCEIRDAAGRIVASAVLESPPAGDELQVLIPSDVLTPGTHTVAITGLESAAAVTSPHEPAHYQFMLRREP